MGLQRSIERPKKYLIEGAEFLVQVLHTSKVHDFNCSVLRGFLKGNEWVIKLSDFNCSSWNLSIPTLTSILILDLHVKWPFIPLTKPMYPDTPYSSLMCHVVLAFSRCAYFIYLETTLPLLQNLCCLLLSLPVWMLVNHYAVSDLILPYSRLLVVISLSAPPRTQPSLYFWGLLSSLTYLSGRKS